MKSKTEILALKVYPKPHGIGLLEADLDTEDKVLKLFDSCQILESIIYPKGWQFLLNKYGLIKLYQIDKISGWFDTNNKKDWLESILYNSLISGYNAQSGHFGKYDGNIGVFVTLGNFQEEIDWDKFKSKSYLLEYED